MLRKSACLLLLAIIASHAAADLGVGRSDFSVSSPDCPQGMAQPHQRSDADLYGTISAIEGPQTRLVSWLGVDLPRSFRITDAAFFLDSNIVLPSVNHSRS